ncbi:MAG: hypothetical protein U0836_09355 [Pirellulales bacterium]
MLLVVSHTVFSASLLACFWVLPLGALRRYTEVLGRGEAIVVLGSLALSLTGAALCFGGGVLGRRVPSATINWWCIATVLGVVWFMLLPAIMEP